MLSKRQRFIPRCFSSIPSPLRCQPSLLIRCFCSAAILPRYSPELRGVYPWKTEEHNLRRGHGPWSGSKPTEYWVRGQQHARHGSNTVTNAPWLAIHSPHPPMELALELDTDHTKCRTMAPCSQTVLGSKHLERETRIKRD
jgi:hypothetical protein